MKIINNQKGMILAMTTGFMLVFTLFGLSTIYLSGMQNQAQEKQIFNTQAFWAAEAGLQKAIYDINHSTWTGWDTVNGNKHFSGQIGTEGDCDITISGLGSTNPTILSTGYTPQGMQLYDATVKLELLANLAAFKYAAFGNTLLKIDKLEHGNLIDGDIGSNVAMDLGSTVGVTTGHTAEVEDPDISLPEIIAPVTTGWSNYGSDANGNLPVPTNNSVTLNSGYYVYDSINMGNNSTLRLRGTVYIYLDSSLGANAISVGNNSDIVIEQDARVVFYVNGNIGSATGNNSLTINTTSSQGAQSFMILGTSNCTSIDIKNTTTLYGVIYAPQAYIDLQNNADIVGSVVGNTVDIKNNGNINYDERLGDIFNQIDPYIIIEWQELP